MLYELNKDFTISDPFCIKFSYDFYNLLLMEKNPQICKVYEKAKKAVASAISISEENDESRYFTILHNHKNKECPSMDLQLKMGKAERKGEQLKLDTKLPSKHNMIIGRIEEGREFIKILSQNDLIWAEGIPGVGKSMFIQYLGSILQDRDVFENGVIYISLKNGK